MSSKVAMSPVSDEPSGPLARTSSPRRVYALVLLIAFVMAAIVGLALFLGVRMTTRYAPLVDAATRIKLEVTTAHLWFEEIVGGDKNEDIETVWAYLDEASWHATAMLDGGTRADTEIVPLDEPALRAAIVDVAEALRAFRRVAEQRLAAAQGAGAGTPVDQQFDRIFQRVLARADEVESKLRSSVGAAQRDARLILTSLLVACLLLGLATVWILGRYERRRSAAVLRLRESEQQLGRLSGEQRFLLENMRDFVYRIGPDGELAFVSSTVEQVTGYGVAEWPAVFARHRGQRPKQAGPWTYRMELPSKLGAALTLELSEQRVGEGEGAAGTIGVARDISQRVRAERERLELERQVLHAQKLESLGVLAGGIAHDFNNLLVAILGNADLAQQDLPPGSPARECLREIELASKRAAGLAKQMLAYSGKGRFVIEAIDLNALIQEMSQLLEVTLARGARIQTDFQKDLPPLNGDATQIQQVVMNLITNASEACGDVGGEITLSTGFQTYASAGLAALSLDGSGNGAEALSAGPYITLVVSDTGCGMDEETAARLFEPFFTTKFSGRGLGMAAVQGIVRGHGGALLVKTAPNEGTRITVLLRAVESEATAEQAAPAPPLASGSPAANAAGYSGRVLIVDDNERVRRVLKWMLKSFGFEVKQAADGEEALQQLASLNGEVRCVFLDLSMPGEQGDEVFTEMRALFPGIQVVLCTGHDEGEVTTDLLERGLAASLQKPFLLRDVEATLGAVLGRRS